MHHDRELDNGSECDNSGGMATQAESSFGEDFLPQINQTIRSMWTRTRGATSRTFGARGNDVCVSTVRLIVVHGYMYAVLF